MKLPSFQQKSKFLVHLMTLHNQLCGDFDGCIIMLCTISILDTQASTDEGNSHVQTIPSIARSHPPFKCENNHRSWGQSKTVIL